MSFSDHVEKISKALAETPGFDVDKMSTAMSLEACVAEAASVYAAEHPGFNMDRDEQVVDPNALRALLRIEAPDQVQPPSWGSRLLKALPGAINAIAIGVITALIAFYLIGSAP